MKKLLLTTALLTSAITANANPHDTFKNNTVYLNTPTEQYTFKMNSFATDIIKSTDTSMFLRIEGNDMKFTKFGMDCPESLNAATSCSGTWEFKVDGGFKGSHYIGNLFDREYVGEGSYSLITPHTSTYDGLTLRVPVIVVGGITYENAVLEFEDGNFKLISYQE